MNTLGEPLQKRAKQHKLREEQRKKTQVLKDIKDIFKNASSFEVDNIQPIIDHLTKIVQKFNKDLNGQDKLLQRDERKFENRVLEQVAQKIAIDQVELSTIIIFLGNIFQ